MRPSCWSLLVCQSLEWTQAGGTWEGRTASQAPPSMLDDDGLRYIRRRRRVQIEHDGVVEEVLLDDAADHVERSGKIFAGGY